MYLGMSPLIRRRWKCAWCKGNSRYGKSGHILIIAPNLPVKNQPIYRSRRHRARPGSLHRKRLKVEWAWGCPQVSWVCVMFADTRRDGADRLGVDGPVNRTIQYQNLDTPRYRSRGIGTGNSRRSWRNSSC